MVRCSWKRVLGNMNLQSWPCDRLLRTAAHLGNISLNLLFLVLAQMFYFWEKWTGHAVRQWEMFSKCFPGAQSLLLLRNIMYT